MAVVVLLLTAAACGKKTEPNSVDFNFETEAPDKRLPEFKGDISELMKNYYMEAYFDGTSNWAAGVNGNFYLGEPTVADFSAEWHNIFSKNCSSSFYDYLYEHYEFLKDGAYSVKSIDKNSDEIIGRKAHKLVLSSLYGETNAYYLDAEYGFCLKITDPDNRTIFEVKKLNIGNVKYNDLKWEQPTNYYTGTTLPNKNVKPTNVFVVDDDTTTTVATIDIENKTAAATEKNEATTAAVDKGTTTAAPKADAATAAPKK